MDKIKLIGLLLIVMVCSFAVGFYVRSPISWDGHKDPATVTNVEFTITSESGTVIYRSGNINTKIGERYDRNNAGFANGTGSDTVNATIYISVGNATPANTLTKLTTECVDSGFVRKAGTPVHWMNGTHWGFNVSATFTASALIAFQSAGLHWNLASDSDANLYACAYLTDGNYHQFTATSTCTVKWIVTKVNT